MKKALLLIAVGLFLCSLFAGCGNSSSGSDESSMVSEAASPSEMAASPAAETTPAPAKTVASEQPKVTDSGALGDYEVSILDCEQVKDYDGKPALRVYFNFANNSKDTTSFAVAIIAKAFQNGVELDSAIVTDTVDEDDNYMKDIKPGAALKCAQTFELSDSSSVEVDVSELFSLTDEQLVKTFDLN